jgi:hypothetical protein
MRMWWFNLALTDWMGDGGWIWLLTGEFRGFNYIGDVTRIAGWVTEKQVEDDTLSVVTVELRGQPAR